LTAFKIVWRVDEEEEDDEELDDDDDDEELDELEEISWLEFVVTIFHSAAGCELSIFECVPKICGKMSRESVGSDSLSFKII
jgi:hypothetical protein